MTHFYMRHDSFLYETRVMYEWDSYTNERREADRTHISMSHVSSICMSHISVSAICMSYPQSVCPLRTSVAKTHRTCMSLKTCMYVFRAYVRHDSHRHASQKRTWLISIWDMTHIWVMSHTEMSHVRFWDVCLCESCSDVGKTRSMSAICMSHISVSTICMSHISVSTICISYPLSVSQSVCHICWYRVAKTHRIHYLYRSFSAKEPYIYRVAKTHRTDCDTDSVSYLLSVSPQYETRVCESCIISYIHRLRR